MGLVVIFETAMDLKQNLYLKVSSSVGTWLTRDVVHHLVIRVKSWNLVQPSYRYYWYLDQSDSSCSGTRSLRFKGCRSFLKFGIHLCWCMTWPITRLQLLPGCRYDKNRQLLQACYVDAAIMAVLSELDQISPMSQCLTLRSHIISIFRFLSSILDCSGAASQDILFPQKTL